jgi:hypothetical protein
VDVIAVSKELPVRALVDTMCEVARGGAAIKVHSLAERCFCQWSKCAPPPPCSGRRWPLQRCVYRGFQVWEARERVAPDYFRGEYHEEGRDGEGAGSGDGSTPVVATGAHARCCSHAVPLLGNTLALRRLQRVWGHQLWWRTSLLHRLGNGGVTLGVTACVEVGLRLGGWAYKLQGGLKWNLVVTERAGHSVAVPT